MNEGILKKRIAILILIFRFLMVLMLFILQYFGGLTEEEFWNTVYIVSPMSLLYLTVVLKFVLGNRYLIRGKMLSRGYVLLVFSAISVIYIVSFIMIILKGVFNLITEVAFYKIICGVESILAIYAGIFLSRLFAPLIKEN